MCLVDVVEAKEEGRTECLNVCRGRSNNRSSFYEMCVGRECILKQRGKDEIEREEC